MRYLRHLPIALLLLAPPSFAQAPIDDGPPNVPDNTPAFPEQTEAPEVSSGLVLRETVIADGLSHPWGMAVLPDGAGFIVTERGGRLVHVTRDGGVHTIVGAPSVRAVQQGGLLDVAIAGDFATSREIYLTYSATAGLAASATAVARATLRPDHQALTGLTEIWRQPITSNVPAHFGSRVVVWTDGSLLISTGDRFTPSN